MPPWVLKLSTDLPHLCSLQNPRMWGSPEEPASGGTASPIPTVSPQCWFHVPRNQEAFLGTYGLKLCPSSGHCGLCHKAWEDPTRARWRSSHGCSPTFRLPKFLLEHPAVSHISSQCWPVSDTCKKCLAEVCWENIVPSQHTWEQLLFQVFSLFFSSPHILHKFH